MKNKTHDIKTRIKKLKGEKLSKEDYDIYCYCCGNKMKWFSLIFPFHCIMGWAHRFKCPKEKNVTTIKWWEKFIKSNEYIFLTKLACF